MPQIAYRIVQITKQVYCKFYSQCIALSFSPLLLPSLSAYPPSSVHSSLILPLHLPLPEQDDEELGTAVSVLRQQHDHPEGQHEEDERLHPHHLDRDIKIKNISSSVCNRHGWASLWSREHWRLITNFVGESQVSVKTEFVDHVSFALQLGT